MKSKIGTIIAVILLLLIASAICSCKSVKYVPLREYHSDTVRISSHDTILVTQHVQNVSVPLPTVYLSNTTKDTVSILTDGLYRSKASIKDGLLHHSLCTLPNAKVDAKVNAKDTTKIHHDAINANRVDSIRVPYPVVKDKIVYALHWWQKPFYYLGIIATIIICIYKIMWCIKKGIIHL